MPPETAAFLRWPHVTSVTGIELVDSRIRATFDIVWLSGWAPHSSQQKPLAPGSARQRLADALGASEHSAGERAGR